MKKTLSLVLALALALTTLPLFGLADGLKGPGNVTLKRLGINVGFDVNADINASIAKEATGYDVTYYSLPAENASEKLMMEVSGGADYDVINCSPNQWRTLFSAGALMPLNDLLNQYGQDILASNDADVWGALSDSEGNIYGLPYMFPYGTEVNSFMTCRWDLMQKAGIEKLPETVDEFYACLKTLKAFYGDEYIVLVGPYLPASAGNENWVFPKVLGCAFGIYNDWMVDENGKVYYMTEAPGFPELINFLEKLNKEGLIDPDWAVNTNSTVAEKFSSGRAIITCINRGGTQSTTPAMIENLKIGYDDLAYITPLKGADGTCTYMKSRYLNQVSCILKNCKNAEDAINWINLKVKNQLFINIGVENVHFTYDEVGAIKPINPIFAKERGNSYWYLDCTNTKEFEQEWPSRVRKSQAQWEAFSAVTLATNETRPEIFVNNPFAFMPNSANYTTYNAALFQSLQDYVLMVMSGTRTLKDLASFRADFAINGGEDVRAELQAYIDAQ